MWKHLSYRQFETLYGDLGLTKWVRYNWLQVLPYDNQWNQDWELGIISGADGSDVPSTTRIRSKGYNPISEYSWMWVNDVGGIYIRFYDAEYNFISKLDIGGVTVFQVPADTAYFRFCLSEDYGITYKGDVVFYKLHNLWDEEWELGTYSASTGSPSSGTTTIRSKSTDPIKALSGTEYFCAADTLSSSELAIFFYDDNDNFISYALAANTTFTTPSNCKYIRFYCSSSYGTTYNHDIAILYLEDL